MFGSHETIHHGQESCNHDVACVLDTSLSMTVLRFWRKSGIKSVNEITHTKQREKKNEWQSVGFYVAADGNGCIPLIRLVSQMWRAVWMCFTICEQYAWIRVKRRTRRRSGRQTICNWQQWPLQCTIGVLKLVKIHKMETRAQPQQQNWRENSHSVNRLDQCLAEHKNRVSLLWVRELLELRTSDWFKQHLRQINGQRRTRETDNRTKNAEQTEIELYALVAVTTVYDANIVIDWCFKWNGNPILKSATHTRIAVTRTQNTRESDVVLFRMWTIYSVAILDCLHSAFHSMRNDKSFIGAHIRCPCHNPTNQLRRICSRKWRKRERGGGRER